MSTVGTARNACAGSGAFLYQRHRPQKTLLYQLVSKHYPAFRQQLAEEARILPGYVQREFEDYLSRMAESAALLVDEVFPHQPVRQWVLSFPFLSACGPYAFSSPAVR